jgi:hypothetical protein
MYSPEVNTKYKKSEKGQASIQRYNSSEAAKAARRRYYQRRKLTALTRSKPHKKIELPVLHPEIITLESLPHVVVSFE